jgi:hypothetical protein
MVEEKMWNHRPRRFMRRRGRRRHISIKPELEERNLKFHDNHPESPSVKGLFHLPPLVLQI